MIQYQLYCDGYLLDDIRTDDYIVENPKVTYEKNKAAGLTFTIYKKHPYYDKIKLKRSIFELQKNGLPIFRGRTSEYTQEFDLTMSADVEGVLTFLNDSIFEPFEFHGSPTDLFINVIENHNAQTQDWQHLKVGLIDILDNNDYIYRESSDYLTSWEVIETRLLNIGGLLRVRYEDDGNYLDWIAGTQEQLNTATQVIKYGENLIDLKKTNSATEMYTAILPLGAESENEDGTKTQVTIENIADDDSTDIVKKGKWIYSKTGVENYGWIAPPPKETTWEDVTVDTNLLKKATDYLTGEAMLITGTLEFNAYDLGLTDTEINSFNFLDYVRAESEMHGVEETYLLSRLELPYKQPQNTKITVGDTRLTLIDEQLGNKYQQSSLIEKVENIRKDYVTNEKLTEVVNQEQINNSEILQTAQEITAKVLENYVETSTFEEYQTSVESEFKQTAEDITASFTKVDEKVTELDGETSTKFEKIEKHIKFDENGITISAGENSIKLRLDNDVIAFYKGEIDENDLTRNRFGHWDGTNFYTGNIIIEVEEKAQFGNFAFVPRSDGSLSFLKVGG